MKLTSLKFLLSTLALWGNVSINAASNEMSADQAEATKNLLDACTAPRGNDDVEVVKTSISFGADVNVVEERSGQTPFMAAVLRGKINIVTYLLENAETLGIDVYKGEKGGFIPVDGAAFQGRADIMKLLLDNTSMSATYRSTTDGFTPFHRSCWGRESRHAEVVKLLVEEYGVDINLPGSDQGDDAPKTCLEMTSNSDIQEFLEGYVQIDPEAATKIDINDEL